MKPVLFACAVATLLGACGPKLLPLADVQQLASRDGAYGQDIYGVRRAAGEPVPAMRGNQVVDIRTFTVKTNDFGNEVRDQEVAGAECLVKAENSEARIRTPGALHVPLYGYRSPEMTVQCVKDGFQDTINTIGTFNLSARQRQQAVTSAGASAGLIGLAVGLAVGAAIAASADETQDVFNYAAPSLLLRPGQGSDALPAPAEPLPQATQTPEPTNAETEPAEAEIVADATAGNSAQDGTFTWE